MKHREQPDTEMLQKWTRRTKLVAKTFGQHGYTPLASRQLASIFVQLSDADRERQIGVLDFIHRIVEEKKNR